MEDGGPSDARDSVKPEPGAKAPPPKRNELVEYDLDTLSKMKKRDLTVEVQYLEGTCITLQHRVLETDPRM